MPEVGWQDIERRIYEAASWRPVLDACPETAGVQLERPRLEAGEPWCTVQIAGLQFYAYDTPGLDDQPLRPDAGERLTLMRRPDNHADDNAIEVWLRNEHLLGHLPRGLAVDIAPDMDRGANLRAYALTPGTGAAWSVRAFLVGTPVAGLHRGWMRAHARDAERTLEMARRQAEDEHRARGAAFAQRQQRARLDRLTQAVRAFECLPMDPAPVPEAGEKQPV